MNNDLIHVKRIITIFGVSVKFILAMERIKDVPTYEHMIYNAQIWSNKRAIICKREVIVQDFDSFLYSGTC